MITRAKNKSGHIVTLFQLANSYDLRSEQARNALRDVRPTQIFTCMECGKKLFIHIGSEKIPHFHHEVDSGCAMGSGESEEHYRLKCEIYDFLKNKQSFAFLKAYNVEFEGRIPETGRRADVLLTHPTTGDRIALEIQHSNISREELDKRTQDYFSSNVEVFWFFDIEKNREIYNYAREKWREAYFYRRESEKVNVDTIL